MPRMQIGTAATQTTARRLVIFDGIMGSGKSTSTRWLGQRLNAQDRAAVASPTVHVIDGQLFHGDVTNLFLMNMPPDDIA
eukprot:gene2789-3615_t